MTEEEPTPRGCGCFWILLARVTLCIFIVAAFVGTVPSVVYLIRYGWGADAGYDVMCVLSFVVASMYVAYTLVMKIPGADLICRASA
ncbi:MAG: hypothetical protein CL902_00935 [Dehalococcoidia bacterium]|mgnify:CR=1 FL=1|nr:hypothetical protein [Dehalococcoidia bacterium]